MELNGAMKLNEAVELNGADGTALDDKLARRLRMALGPAAGAVLAGVAEEVTLREDEGVATSGAETGDHVASREFNAHPAITPTRAAASAVPKSDQSAHTLKQSAVRTTQRGWGCAVCRKNFHDEVGYRKHMVGMSGRRGHPIMTYADSGELTWGARVPLGLDAQRDVAVAKDPANGTMYWFNPKTMHAAWSWEAVVRANMRLYPKVLCIQSHDVVGPGGEEEYWHHAESGTTAWTLAALHADLCTRGWRPDSDDDGEDPVPDRTAQTSPATPFLGRDLETA
eukprot:gnl/TRDRNA2_/TRDRNA2_125939_c0_seq1.p2 gnl/TRDRNA2_/TRDRNA2_125939_c0~~gnl/TRDRNA2_/TRDRNA2_125939_c0_seq1.p2  ORF type:complete len:282 (-),score=51.64 gnl/TRDRNA2_/TRDRNA2_125939_c0_seq1:43-888(-)